eukprot:TRINITY_DN9297_c0_g1_i1.p1 TRINITY_DN9297_c0_g1~~TRINITY_DN9297_c0_g1_i1.p1  ORF type:complete len:385 (+),score=76.51 TRINITY_DN9297_c0_g1_i1:149-1156(+)
MDWDQYSTRHIALKYMYIGTNYCGVAYQHDPTINSVERELLQAATRTRIIPENFTLESINFSRSGRTDRGVHAFGQVVSFLARSIISDGIGITSVGHSLKEHSEELDYIGLLNRSLPDDIRVHAWTPIPPQFSARFDTKCRVYYYLFFEGLLNIELMKEAGNQLLGTHNFVNFCKIDPACQQFERTMLEFDIVPMEESDGLYAFKFVGSSFLWHQVRNMVAVLFKVGELKEDPSVIRNMLDVSLVDTIPPYNMASEHNLILFDCVYDGIDWKYNDSVVPVHKHFTNILNGHLMNKGIINVFLDNITPHIDSAAITDTLSSKKIYTPILQRNRNLN